MKALGFIKKIDELLEEKGLGFVSTLIDVTLTFLIAWLLVRGVSALIRRALRAKARPEDAARAKRLDTAATLAMSISKYMIYFFAAAIAIGQLGLTASMSSLLTAAGIGGLVLGIGAQSLVKDIVSGFFMLFENQFSVGDYITAAGITGTVEAVALRTTTIKSYTGEVTVVPNGSITTLTNYSRTNALALIELPVSSGEDTQRALELMLEESEAYREELGDKAKGNPEAAGVIRAENGTLLLRITLPVAPLAHWGVQRELTARIAARFAREGIAAPYSRISIVHQEEREHG